MAPVVYPVAGSQIDAAGCLRPARIMGTQTSPKLNGSPALRRVGLSRRCANGGGGFTPRRNGLVSSLMVVRMLRPKIGHIKKWLLVSVGCIAMILGVIGLVLPGLPTTPFVLLAAACFAKASPQLHSRLLQHRLLGPTLRDWETHRSLSLKVKCFATSLMLAMVFLAVWQLQQIFWAAGMVLALGCIGAWVVWRIPTREI